jgi:hypothetical protein
MDDNLRITSIERLKETAGADGGLNAYIALNGGARSSKLLSYNPDNDSWSVLHEIDDIECLYASTDEMLEVEPLLAEAIEAGALWAHWLD